jgi:hypothetical protein
MALPVLNRDAAWDRLMTIDNFGSGNSKANSLYWAATRPAPLPGFNVSNTQSALSTASTSACSANTACDAIGKILFASTLPHLPCYCAHTTRCSAAPVSFVGMLGECCPSATGIRLQCCPAVSLP